MGLLDNLKQQKTNKNTTRDFYLGSTEAEAENKEGTQNLASYFDDYFRIFNQISEGRFIITGRKGVGKSAYAKHIFDTAQKSNGESYCELIRISELKLETFLQANADSNISNDKERILLEWLILVRLIKLIVKNKAAEYSEKYKALKRFLDKNIGEVEIDKNYIESVDSNKKNGVNIELLGRAFSAEFGKYFSAKETKAPFYRLIPLLKEIVPAVLTQDVFKDKDYWILFDDLDIDLSVFEKTDLDRIIDLIRTAKHYNNELFNGLKCRVIVFLRDDIKRAIKNNYADAAKIFTSYEAELNWFNYNAFRRDENSTELKKLINKRIEINFKHHNIAYTPLSPWDSLVENYAGYPDNKSAFKFILDYTFYRPRDLVLFFSPIGREDYKTPLNYDIIYELLKRYVRENFSEIKNELRFHFDPEEIRDIEQFLRKMSQQASYSYSFVISLLDEYEFHNYNSEQILKLLCSYSILIVKKNENYFYNYRDEVDLDSLDLESIEFTLHKGIHMFFRP